MEIEKKKITFLGDSITEGVGVSSPDHKFVNCFLSKYNPAIVRNYGISGSRIAKQQSPAPGNPSYERYFATRVSEMDTDADIVVVFGGVNDYAHGDAPLGCFEDNTSDTFYGACHVLMTALINQFPMATIIFMTPLHTEVTPQNKIGTPAPLIEYVRAIREVAESYAIPILDLYSMSGINANIPSQREKMIPDGIHPNDIGAERIADRLAGFLRSL